MHRARSFVISAAMAAGLTALASQGAMATHRPVGYGEAFAALEASTHLNLSALEETARIEIVPMSTLEPVGEADAEAFAKMKANHADALDAVRDQVEENAQIMSALETEGYTAGEVVAVWNDADREVTVFVERR